LMNWTRRIALFSLAAASAFAQVRDVRTLFDSGLAGTLLSASTPPGSITDVKASEGWGTTTNFAAGSWVQIVGSKFTDIPFQAWDVTQDFTDNIAPTSLGGVSVTINNKPAYVYYITPGQIGVEAPDDPKTGSVQVVVTNRGVAS